MVFMKVLNGFINVFRLSTNQLWCFDVDNHIVNYFHNNWKWLTRICILPSSLNMAMFHVGDILFLFYFKRSNFLKQIVWQYRWLACRVVMWYMLGHRLVTLILIFIKTLHIVIKIVYNIYKILQITTNPNHHSLCLVIPIINNIIVWSA